MCDLLAKLYCNEYFISNSNISYTIRNVKPTEVKHVKVNTYLMQKHLWCKKVQPSKVESYLEVNA